MIHSWSDGFVFASLHECGSAPSPKDGGEAFASHGKEFYTLCIFLVVLGVVTTRTKRETRIRANMHVGQHILVY